MSTLRFRRPVAALRLTVQMGSVPEAFLIAARNGAAAMYARCRDGLRETGSPYDGPPPSQADGAAHPAAQPGHGAERGPERSIPGIANDVPPMLDAHMLSALFERHARALRARLLRRLGRVPDAEEALQEVFLRTWNARDRAIRDPGAFLFGVAEKVALETLRERGRWKYTDHAEAPERDDGPTPEQVLGDRQTVGRVLDAVAAMPAARRAAYHMFLEGHTQNQIAARLGLSRAMARKHLDRAFAEIHALVDDPAGPAGIAGIAKRDGRTGRAPTRIRPKPARADFAAPPPPAAANDNRDIAAALRVDGDDPADGAT